MTNRPIYNETDAPLAVDAATFEGRGDSPEEMEAFGQQTGECGS